jgi:hypothetical protein
VSKYYLPPTSPEKYHLIFKDLYSQPGVSGICLQSKQTVLVHDFPYSDSRTAEMIGDVERLIQGYETVGREIWQICLGFQRLWLLVVTSAPLRLSILVLPDSDCELIASRGMRLLLQANDSLSTSPPVEKAVVAPVENAEQGVISRQDLERILAGLLGRVSGITQATKIVQRVLSLRHANTVSFPIAEAEELGGAVLDYVSNRGKRAALHSEFLTIIKP